MWLLAELFEELPEVGDPEKPKLVFFFDEAHLLFSGATDAFIESVVTTVRMIRSKGVGIFFSTQVPRDVHKDVLAQARERIQHALRAFTPEDAKALKAAVSTYPRSDFYDLEELLPRSGSARRRSPSSRERRPDAGRPHADARAGFADGAGGRRRCGREGLAALHEVRDSRRRRECAREARRQRLEAPEPAKPAEAPKPTRRAKDAAKATHRGGDPLTDFLTSREGKSLQRKIVRGVFGLLKKSSTRRSCSVVSSRGTMKLRIQTSLAVVG